MSGIVGQNLGRGSGLIKAGAIDDDSVTLAKMAGLARGKLIYGDTSGDPAALAVGGADEVLTHDGTDFDWAAASGGASLRPNAQPLIINGDMDVAQRSTSVASITTSGYNTVDRWYTYIITGGTWTQTQEALGTTDQATTGQKTALKMDNTIANGSLSATSIVAIWTILEAQDVQLIKKGTSAAETLTLSFWVKATKTGTNIARLYAADSDRSCCQAYTVDSTDTWEKKVLNYPADTTGVIANDNGNGIFIIFGVAAGSNSTSGTLATTWAADAGANNFVGQVNNADSDSNNFHITGVQLEVGTYTSSTIPPFQHESYGENLFRCQRYYQIIADGSAHCIGLTTAYNATTSYSIVKFITEMRSDAVALEYNSGSNYYALLCENSNTGFDDFATDQTRTNMMRLSDDGSTGKSQGASGWFECSAGGRVAVEDEL